MNFVDLLGGYCYLGCFGVIWRGFVCWFVCLFDCLGYASLFACVYSLPVFCVMICFGFDCLTCVMGLSLSCCFGCLLMIISLGWV